MGTDSNLRRHVVALLEGKGAHLTFDAVMDGWPAAARASKPDGAVHTAWQLLEHLRLAQRDILDFCVADSYEELAFPDDYWPPVDQVPDEAAWTGSLERFRHDLERMQQLVADPGVDLLQPIPRGTGQTILREALLVADHNAYHLGQLALLRRLLDSWHSPALPCSTTIRSGS